MSMDIIAGIAGSAIGAFLGFLGALYLQSSADKRDRANRSELVLRNIKCEITDISQTLSQYLEKGVPLNYDIQTPNWDAALYSGAILEFIESPVYLQTIAVYSSIEHFNDVRKSLSKEDNIKELQYIVDASNYITE